MAKPKKASRDWLEPPEWWKKWRPLRWIAGALILVIAVSLVRSLIPDRTPTPDAAPRPPAEGPEVASIEPPLPVEGAPDATPTPATPAPVPKPEPKPETKPPPVVKPEPAVVSPPPKPVEVEDEETTPAPKAGSALDRYTRVERARVALMSQFRSYSSVDEVSAALKKAGYADVSVVSNHRRLKDGAIPPYDLDSIAIERYTHLGQPGELNLSFFNDRLFEAEFEPEDAEAYVAAMRRAEPRLKRTRSGRTEFTEGPLYVNSSLDLATSDVGRTLGTRAFVLWQDQRIVKQRDAWDGEFGMKAAR